MFLWSSHIMGRSRFEYITWCIVTSQRAGHAGSKLILNEKLPSRLIVNRCLLYFFGQKLVERVYVYIYIYIRFHKHHTRSARTKSKKGWNGSVQRFGFGCSIHAAMLRLQAPVFLHVIWRALYLEVHYSRRLARLFFEDRLITHSGAPSLLPLSPWEKRCTDDLAISSMPMIG